MQSSSDTVLPWSTSYYTVHEIKNYSEQYWFSLSSHPRQTNGGKLSRLQFYNLHDTKKAKQSILSRRKLVEKKINDPHSTSFDKWTTLIYTKAVQLFQLIEHKNYSEQNWLALSSHQKKKLTNILGTTVLSRLQFLITCTTQKKTKWRILSSWKLVLKKQTPTYIIQGGDWCTLPTIVLLSVHVKNFLSIHRHKPAENTFLKV